MNQRSIEEETKQRAESQGKKDRRGSEGSSVIGERRIRRAKKERRGRPKKRVGINLEMQQVLV